MNKTKATKWDKTRSNNIWLACANTVNMTTASVVVRNILAAGTAWLFTMFTCMFIWNITKIIIRNWLHLLVIIKEQCLITNIAQMSDENDEKIIIIIYQMSSSHQGEANRPPEPPVGHDELLVPADWVDVLPHQVHHRRQREDGHESALKMNIYWILHIKCKIHMLDETEWWHCKIREG